MNAHAPTFVKADPRQLALQELKDNDFAVALARVAAVARKETAALDRPAKDSVYRPAFDVVLDSFALCHDELDGLAYLAAKSQNLDRSDLPSTGEIVDRLAVQS